MTGSFNDRVRQAVEGRFKVGEVFATRQAWEAADLSSLERRRVWTALRDLSKYGEVEALGEGRWRRVPREERPELKEIMWRLLRIHRVMTVEDMTRQSGASPRTVQEFFQAKMRLGLVVNEAGKPGRYRLVRDPGPQPPPDANGERQRQIRLKKKQEALAKLDAAFAAVAEARMAVSQLEEE